MINDRWGIIKIVEEGSLELENTRRKIGMV